MARLTVWEALRPVAARMPKVVRELEILRVAAAVRGKDRVKSAETARREILAWAQKRCGGQLPQDAWSFQDFEYFSGGRNSVGVRIKNGQSDIWALRADDPDKTVPGRVWTTEVVVGLSGAGPPRFSARLLASTAEDELEIDPHTPGFVQQVAENCGLSRGLYEVSAEPRLIDSDGEAERLIDMLIDQRRALPLFVLTVPEGSDDPHRPLLDAQGLARATLGIGHVAVVPDIYTWALTRRFGKQRSVFGGAVRAYLPGFAEDASPYSHRLALPDHISTPEGVAQCTRWMRLLAATESVRRARLGHEVLAFAAVRNASLEFKQHQLEREGASESALLETANARIKALEKQIEDEKAAQEFFASEHESAEARAEAAEEQMRGAVFRVQQLLDQIKSHGETPDANIALPSTWSSFTDWCETHLAGRLVLSPRARRSLRSPDFEDAELAARCLLWLANDYRNRRMGGGEGSLRDQAVEDGIWNAHCGSDQFDLDWQGERHTADWHIKNGGNTRDPRRCLRIYHFWDATTQQVVIAEMPAHRRTDAT